MSQRTSHPESSALRSFQTKSVFLVLAIRCTARVKRARPRHNRIWRVSSVGFCQSQSQNSLKHLTLTPRRGVAPPAAHVPPPAPPQSATAMQRPTRCGRCRSRRTSRPPSRADRSALLHASSPASRRSSRRSCCPDRGRAACRCSRTALSLSASLPSCDDRGSGSA